MLDPPALVVDVMEYGIVGGKFLQGVEGERIARVVIHSLYRGQGIEEHTLADGLFHQSLGDDRPHRVEEEPFYWVVVKSSKCEGNVKPVVNSMDTR